MVAEESDLPLTRPHVVSRSSDELMSECSF